MQIKLLGVALGLASLAGINLYLTVFVTGLAVHEHWILLSQQYQGLEVLGHPAVIAVAGILYFIQFFADKIPWVDSLWDSIHTVIRPIGGALLALHTFGHMNPVFDVIVVLLAGGAALATHGVKAGTRIIANTSPEPFSNIALSVAEDVLVIGGLVLLYCNPVLMLGILLVFFACLFYLGPKVFRVLATRLWLVWRKLNAPAADKTHGELSAALPVAYDIIFTRMNLTGEKIEWAARCISTASHNIPSNHFGYLIATVEEPRKLWFVAKGGLGKIAEELDLEGCVASQESKFLTENLVIHHADKKHKHVFLFDRAKNALVRNLVASLEHRLGPAGTAPEHPEPGLKPVAG
jgi:hypothetical protein